MQKTISTYRRTVNYARRIRLGMNVIGSLLLVAGLEAAPLQALEEPPELTIGRLEFRVVDTGDNARPVRSFSYSFECYSSQQGKPLSQRHITYQSEDGILHIPKPFPPFGRIRVWIDVDDLKAAYRHGYRAFSYRIGTEQPAGPATIQLEPGIVITGKVFDAETDKPIIGAEVAPLKWGHHSSWADWDELTKTDTEGKYRIVTKSAQGIEARHPKYRTAQSDDRPYGFSVGHNKKGARWSSSGEQKEPPKLGPDGVVIRLHPLMTLRGRLVDVDGRPIEGAPIWYRGRGESDEQGRFEVTATQEEWTQPKDGEVSIWAEGHRSLDVPLREFSFERETVVTLEKEQLIEGRVLNENGQPVDHCTIELKCDSPPMVSDFDTIPHEHGKWREHISEHDEVFTLRVSVAGVARSLKRYNREEVLRGPIITNLVEGRRLAGNLVAKVPLDQNNTPVVFLRNAENEELSLQGKVQADGSFGFVGLADGKYVLQLHPANCRQYRGGHMNQGVAAYSMFGFESRNKPWQKEITIAGKDVGLEAVNLHDARLLPGRVTGVAFHPGTHQPLANAFGYVCSAESNFDTVGGCYYLLQCMTDADGRFQIDSCPPGEYVLRLTDDASGYGHHDPSVWIRVVPEKTLDLRLFGPEADRQLAIDFIVGDGSSRDVHAGAALDAHVIAKYADPKTGKLPFIKDDNDRIRAGVSEIICELTPHEETATHWPIYTNRFKFIPANLPKGNPRDVVIPNLSPGHWRLTLQAVYDGVYSSSETVPTRDLQFREGMPPLAIKLPAASLAGRFNNPARTMWGRATIEAVPRADGLPARTCRGQTSFRFIGLAPGEYSLRFQANGCETKLIENVIVRKGEVTWLDTVTLKRATPTEGEVPGHEP